MTQIELTNVKSGDQLDVVTLTDGGELNFATGRAKDMFVTTQNAFGMSPVDVFAYFTSWSNGYWKTQAISTGDADAGAEA